MTGERLVAGLLCSEILAGLSDYMEGGLEPALRVRFADHIRGCDACTRFGGRFAGTVTRLRETFLDEPVPTAVLERVRALIAR